MARKSNFCETHSKIHNCEFTGAAFVAKKQEELISKRMNRLLNPSTIVEQAKDIKPKKGSFAHILQNAKIKNEKLKQEINYLKENDNSKIDEKTVTNCIEQLRKSVLQNSNDSNPQGKTKKERKI